MRIAIVVFDYCRENTRLLPWLHIHELSHHLSKLGHNIVIISDGYPRLSRIDSVDGISVIHLRHVKHFPPSNFEEIGTAINKVNPDAILWLMGLTGFFQKKLFKKLKYPIVALMDSPIYLPHELLKNVGLKAAISNNSVVMANFIETFFPKFLIRDTLNLENIRYVVSLSKKNNERLELFGVNSFKLKYFPVGVANTYFLLPSSKIVEETKKIVSCDEKSCILITYCGPPLELRGIYTIIEAAKIAREKLSSSGFSFHLSFLLRERNNEFIRQRLKLIRKVNEYGLGDIVNFQLGFLSKDKIKANLLISDVIILPFRHVTSDVPFSIIEAMALGKTVLSTTLDGIPELLEKKRGLLVSPNDVSKMADFIVHLAKNKKLLTQYGKRAKKYMLDQPSWEETAANMVLLLSNIIDK